VHATARSVHAPSSWVRGETSGGGAPPITPGEGRCGSVYERFTAAPNCARGSSAANDGASSHSSTRSVELGRRAGLSPRLDLIGHFHSDLIGQNFLASTWPSTLKPSPHRMILALMIDQADIQLTSAGDHYDPQSDVPQARGRREPAIETVHVDHVTIKVGQREGTNHRETTWEQDQGYTDKGCQEDWCDLSRQATTWQAYSARERTASRDSVASSASSAIGSRGKSSRNRRPLENCSKTCSTNSA